MNVFEACKDIIIIFHIRCCCWWCYGHFTPSYRRAQYGYESTTINEYLKNQLKSPHFSIFNDAAYIVRFNYYYNLCEHGEQRVRANDLTHFTLDFCCSSFFISFLSFGFGEINRLLNYSVCVNAMTDDWCRCDMEICSQLQFVVERNIHFIISFVIM